MRRVHPWSFVSSLAVLSMMGTIGCSAQVGGTVADDRPDDRDDVVATEASADALQVTSTPGKAVWTRLWRYTEALVGKLSQDGSVQYARSYGGPGRHEISGVGIDSYGQVVFSLNFFGTVTVGSKSYSTEDNNGDSGMVLAKLSPVEGGHRWSRGYLGTSAQSQDVSAKGLAISSSDRILVVGTFRKDTDFGNGLVSGSLAGNAFFTRFYQ